MKRIATPPGLRETNSEARRDAGPLLRSGGFRPKPTRLALEMALNEEQERRALEGELAQLEAAGREAGETAAITDNLFLPEHTGEFLERHSHRGRSGK